VNAKLAHIGRILEHCRKFTMTLPFDRSQSDGRAMGRSLGATLIWIKPGACLEIGKQLTLA
jgi:hypothetical protein